MVYLEVLDEPTTDLPKNSKAVVFTEIQEKEPPLHITIASIEGAIEAGDKQHASELIASLDPEELQSPEVSSLVEKLKT